MNDFGLFLAVDGFEQSGQCDECEKRNVPVMLIQERYFGDGAPGQSESAHICEKCIGTFHAGELQPHGAYKLRAMFGRRAK